MCKGVYICFNGVYICFKGVYICFCGCQSFVIFSSSCILGTSAQIQIQIQIQILY
jgi:hypothetical protein